MWVYAILFLIIYSETGLVIAPFLPGDSLLFVAGALCGMGALQLEWLVPLLVLAAFSGDNTNYWVGRLVGIQLLKRCRRADSSGASTSTRPTHSMRNTAARP